ncbi:MAG: HD-GYP domain-containing protein [Actinomycetota bacterium]
MSIVAGAGERAAAGVSRRKGALRALLLFVAVLVLPNAFLYILRTTPGLDILLDSPSFHLGVVSAISFCALVVAIAAAVAALRARKPVLVLVALGCLSVGIFMLAHGVSTPGLGFGDGVNIWFHRFPILAIAGFAVCLTAATRRNNRTTRLIARHPGAALLVPTLLMVALGVGAVVLPTDAEQQHDYGQSYGGYGTDEHEDEHDSYGAGIRGDGYGSHGGDEYEEGHGAYEEEYGHDKGAVAHTPGLGYLSQGYGDRSSFELVVMVGVAVLGALMLLFAARSYWFRWRYGQDPVEFSLLLACLLSLDAIVAVLFGTPGRLSWFDYHAYLLAGFGAAALAVMFGYRRAHGVDGALHSLTLTETVDQVFNGSPEALRVLIGAVEARDLYTQGHSRRVSEMSARIGVAMGLGPDQVRLLVQGAIIHDIGKIGMPDSVLNKQGPLTRDERKLIEEHPIVGWDIAKRVASLQSALPVIRHHHERHDGLGYPDRLQGASIPFYARIVAVADVWDALTSNRSYREAWSQEKTLHIMREGRGTQFDPECLDAFMRLMHRKGYEPETLEPLAAD